MKLCQTLQCIYSDYRLNRATGEKSWVQVVFFSQGFWASLIYRLSHLRGTEVKIPFIIPRLRFFKKIAQKTLKLLQGSVFLRVVKLGRDYILVTLARS